MVEAYTDEHCRYLGGDPRLAETGPAKVGLRDDCIRIELLESEEEAAVLRIPKSAIQGVRKETQRLGMEQAEYEEDIVIGPHEWLTRFTVVLDVNDPEGVEPGGLQVRVGFRDEYFSKVFVKRCREAYSLAPF